MCLFQQTLPEAVPESDRHKKGVRKVEEQTSNSFVNMKTRGFAVVLSLKTRVHSPFKQLGSTI